MPQQNDTVAQFYQDFKQSLKAGSRTAADFASQMDKKFPGDRKFTPEDVASFWASTHDGVSFSDLPKEKITTTLQTLSGKPSSDKSPAVAPASVSPGTPESPGGSDGQEGMASKAWRGLTTPLLEGVREGSKKLVDSYYSSPVGVISAAVLPKTTAFTRGFSKGLVDFGVDMTSVANLGVMAASAFGGTEAKLISKFPILKYAPKLIKGGFTVEMLRDLAKDIPEVKAAYDRGDLSAAGQAASKSLAEVVMLTQVARSDMGGKKAPVKESAKIPPPSEAAAVKESASAKPAPKQAPKAGPTRYGSPGPPELSKANPSAPNPAPEDLKPAAKAVAPPAPKEEPFSAPEQAKPPAADIAAENARLKAEYEALKKKGSGTTEKQPAKPKATTRKTAKPKAEKAASAKPEEPKSASPEPKETPKPATAKEEPTKATPGPPELPGQGDPEWKLLNPGMRAQIAKKSMDAMGIKYTPDQVEEIVGEINSRVKEHGSIRQVLEEWELDPKEIDKVLEGITYAK